MASGIMQVRLSRPVIFHILEISFSRRNLWSLYLPALGLVSAHMRAIIIRLPKVDTLLVTILEVICERSCDFPTVYTNVISS